MRVSELGEFGLIARIAEKVGGAGDAVVVGIGDDAAVLRTGGDKYLIATCDIQVEGVHFLQDRIIPYQLGRKAVAINLSDIASMGGVPKHLWVSLVLPQDMAVEYVDGLYEGMVEETRRHGVDIVGGNVARSPSGLVVDTFLVGEVKPESLLLRSGARVGDLVLVTGHVGDSAAGLALVLDPAVGCDEGYADKVLKAHLTPTPRLKEGRVIAGSGLATAMIDVSDGVLADLGHICERSEVGARIWAERLPISDAARAVAMAVGKDPLEWALGGGEDYELLFTASADKAKELAALVREETGTLASVIGEIVPAEEGIEVIQESGEPLSLKQGGWDHFRPAQRGRAK
jgi:thiamine-monophosphate kinase